MPVATPDNSPVVVLMVAAAGVDDIQVPPAGAQVSVVDAVRHSALGPEIAAGAALTVTSAVRKHPLVNLYVIVVVPDETPVTVPLGDWIVATPVLLLVQTPKVVMLNKFVEVPTHTY